MPTVPKAARKIRVIVFCNTFTNRNTSRLLLKAIMKFTRSLPLWAVAFAVIPSVGHAASNVDAERERWVVHSRSGEAERGEAVAALRRLYDGSGDKLVRADLIALLIRGGQQQEALAVCAACRPDGYSADELQNLAKAARDTKKFDTAALFYRELQTRFPQQKTGLLGGALTAVDMARYSEAEVLIKEYRRRFGSDADIQTAENYLNKQTTTLTGRLAGQLGSLGKSSDKETVLQAYRTAAEMQVYPMQERLLESYPQYFSENDRQWLKTGKAVSLLRSALATNNRAQLETAYRELNAIIAAAPENSAIYIAALRDRMTAANALEKHEETLADYRRLAKTGEQPDFVKAQYAHALLATGSPNQASAIFRGIADRQIAQSKRLSDDTNEQLIQAYAEAVRYSKAKLLIRNWNTAETALDFTRNAKIKNPLRDKAYFWNARLDAWNGRPGKAVKDMDAWLAEHPADPWALTLRGELAQWDGHDEEAREWFRRAKEYMPPDSQEWVDNKIAQSEMSSGNWKEAGQYAAAGADKPNFSGFRRQYIENRAPQFVANAQAMKTTSPSDGTEWGQDATLYSKRSADGHRAYVTERSAYVPNHGSPLRAGRAGVGAQISLYPATVTVEAGHGFDLNRKAYALASADYRLTGRLKLKADAAYNSANTPVKALNQNVYAHEYNLAVEYRHSSATQIGAGIGLMDVDDGNLRKSANVWMNNLLYQYDRWQLGSKLWADYSANKDIPKAHYYNPKNSKSLSGTLQLSYTAPLDNGISLKQTVSGGAGRYWQSGVAAENTWNLSYGHDWQFGRKTSLTYEFGRRQAMYDGQPEFQNFGNIGLNMKFN